MAKVKRSGGTGSRSRSRGRSRSRTRTRSRPPAVDLRAVAEKVLLHPIGLVALGVLLVLVVGYWVQHSLDDAAAGGETPPAASSGNGSVADGRTGGTAPDTGGGDAGGSGGTVTPPGGDGSEPGGTAPATGGGDAAPVGAQPGNDQTTEPDEPSGAFAVDPAIQAARARIDRSGGATDTMLITVYYVDGFSNAMALQPVQMKVPRDVARIRLTTEQIINAPEELRLYSSVPEGTQILGADFDKDTGVATVDLSPEAANVSGSAAVNNMVAAFVYSLTEIPGVKSVRLWVNGHPAQLHGFVWDRPLTREEIPARNYYEVLPVIEYEESSSS